MWFVIRDQGVSGLKARIRRDLENARWLEGEVRREPHWKLLAPVRLQTLVLHAVNQSGEAYLTPALIGGHWALRVSLGAVNTEREHVADLWRLLRAKAAALPGT
jgi:aromatic-L-amino-acid decarboxylase